MSAYHVYNARMFGPNIEVPLFGQLYHQGSAYGYTPRYAKELIEKEPKDDLEVDA